MALTIVCVVLSVLLLVALIWVIALKHDLRQITGQVARIGSMGTNSRLTTSTYDHDAVALTENINHLLERNRHDVLETARSEANLKKAITNVVHDLRTPLTSALGYLQMVRSGTVDDRTSEHYLGIVEGRLHVLSGLMDNLFDYARVIEAPAFVLKPDNICNALRDGISACYPELETQGIAIDADIPDTPVMCWCDDEALRRVIQNLLKNVVAHGKDLVRVRVAGPVIEIANRTDNLPDLDVDQIFERFYTADAARTSQNTGLGLAITKELVTRMNGRVSASIESDLLVMRVTLQPSSL